MPSVLVLDHEAQTRARLARVVASGGHTVFEASESDAAMSLAVSERPDLAIVDILMPAMDAYEFIRQLRCDATAAQTRVVFSATGSVNGDLDRLAESCGVEHVLSASDEAAPILGIVTMALDASAACPPDFSLERFDREYVHAIHASLVAHGVKLRTLNHTHERLNEELRSSQVRYRALFELSPQPILVYERDTYQILAVNNSSVANYGYSREEFLSMTLVDLVPVEDIPSFERYAASRAALWGHGEGRGLTLARQWRHRLKDGTVIDVEITSDDIVFDGRTCRILLSQDVTARKRTAAELSVAHDAAVEASTLKSAFLANISHEMRTPMNGVLGMNGLLLATHLTDEQRKYAAQVSRSAEEMMAIIDDVLDVAKIEAGGILLDLTDFPLREAVERACALGARQAAAKGLAFELRFDDAVPQRAHGDDLRLRRIVAKLVSNAVKFTAVGSVVVHVSARAASHSGALRMRVEVVDTGIGVDPAALEHMFEPFTQADTSLTRAYGGAGLGLTIARNVVALMGGTLGADSLLAGGSTFWFEIDLRPAVEMSQRHDLRRVTPSAVRALSRSWSSRAPHVSVPRRRRWD